MSICQCIVAKTGLPCQNRASYDLQGQKTTTNPIFCGVHKNCAKMQSVPKKIIYMTPPQLPPKVVPQLPPQVPQIPQVLSKKSRVATGDQPQQLPESIPLFEMHRVPEFQFRSSLTLDNLQTQGYTFFYHPPSPFSNWT